MLNVAPWLIDKVARLLPPSLESRVREARKAIVAGAGAALTLVTALNHLPLPPAASGAVASAVMVLTAVVTWGTPNEQP
jgi:hypothetical protein